MYKVEKWIAIDGKEFDSEEECHYYEAYLDLINPDFFKFFDENGCYIDFKDWLDKYCDFEKWGYSSIIDFFQEYYSYGVWINCNDAEYHPGLDIISEFLEIYTETEGFYILNFEDRWVLLEEVEHKIETMKERIDNMKSL